MFTSKTTFDPSDCHIIVETQHLTRFDQLDNPFIDQISIKLYDEENRYMARMTVMRIPSNQRVNASELYGTFYNMADLMHNTSAELSTIADELGLGWRFRTIYCRGGLDHNDLYQVVEAFVHPEYRRMGIGTWMFSNLQMMLARITHDREPVVVLYPPRVVENGKVVFEIDQWVKDLYKKTGWNPVKDGAHTLYYNPD
jgi:GNAT superfamily N-acetyltransferase